MFESHVAFTGGPTPLPLESSLKEVLGVIIHSSCLVALTSLESSTGSGSRPPPLHICLETFTAPK